MCGGRFDKEVVLGMSAVENFDQVLGQQQVKARQKPKEESNTSAKERANIRSR